MLYFAEWTFYAYGYDKDDKGKRLKHTRLQGWEQIKKSGMMPQELIDRPILPKEGIYIWMLYKDIKKGCDNVGYTELDAYQKVKGEQLTNWEADLLIELDLIRRNNG